MTDFSIDRDAVNEADSKENLPKIITCLSRNHMLSCDFVYDNVGEGPVRSAINRFIIIIIMFSMDMNIQYGNRHTAYA
jgi:hypothetical protein